MLVDRFDHGAEHRQEHGVFLRVAAGVEQVPAAVAHRPVVVLAGTVDARERLLVQQALEPVLFGDIAEGVHDQHVVVAREVQLLELRRELELRRRDLVVARLGGDAEPPELALDVVHEGEDAVRDRSEVVVFELLAFRGRRAEEGPPGLDEVGTPLPVFAIDKEILLLGAKCARGVFAAAPEEAHQTVQRAVERLHRAQQRGLLVERLAGVRAERGRDAERRAVGVALDESRARRIPRRVAAGFERRADAARGEGRGVGLAHDEILAAELHYRLAVLDFKEGVVLLGCRTGHGEEPVRVVRRTAVHGPVAYSVRHFAGDRRIKGLALLDRRLELFGSFLAQVGVYGFFAEDIGSEIGSRLRFLGHVWVVPVRPRFRESPSCSRSARPAAHRQVDSPEFANLGAQLLIRAKRLSTENSRVVRRRLSLKQMHPIRCVFFRKLRYRVPLRRDSDFA